MPFYEYECYNCDTKFELMVSINDADKDAVCTSCGAGGSKRCFTPTTNIIYIGDSWSGKNVKLMQDRMAKSELAAKRQRDYYGPGPI